MEFKGFDDWIEIFKTGTHTDSDGNTKEWTDEDLDQIAASYIPEENEAPVVIGHPTENAPAYGWVEKLKKDGDTLYAKFKDLVPKFVDMVKKGRFKKRSISLYPDLSLRHIGFLGAMAPAIKGLKAIAFSGGEGITIEFGEPSPWIWEAIARVFGNLRDWLIEKEGKDAADKIIASWEIDDIKGEANKSEPEDKSFTRGTQEKQTTSKERADTNNVRQNKLEKKGKGGTNMSIKDVLKNVFTKAVDELPDDALEGIDAPRQFTEAEVKAREKAAADKARGEGKDAAKTEFTEQQKKDRSERKKTEIKSYCEQLKKEGKLIPAWEKLGLQEFMLSLDSEEVMEFAEGAKVSRADWFKGFLDELPKVIDFEEIASRDKDAGGGGDNEKREKLISDYMGQNKDTSYKEAVLAISSKHPELFERRE